MSGSNGVYSTHAAYGVMIRDVPLHRYSLALQLGVACSPGIHLACVGGGQCGRAREHLPVNRALWSDGDLCFTPRGARIFRRRYLAGAVRNFCVGARARARVCEEGGFAMRRYNFEYAPESGQEPGIALTHACRIAAAALPPAGSDMETESSNAEAVACVQVCTARVWLILCAAPFATRQNLRVDEGNQSTLHLRWLQRHAAACRQGEAPACWYRLGLGPAPAGCPCCAMYMVFVTLAMTQSRAGHCKRSRTTCTSQAEDAWPSPNARHSTSDRARARAWPMRRIGIVV